MAKAKKDLIALFYNNIEQAKSGYDTYIDMIGKTTTFNLDKQRKIINLYINYRKLKRFPTEQLVLAFNAFFTEKEVKQFLEYLDENRPKNHLEETGSLDELIAKQVFRTWIDRNLEEAKGSYKTLVRKTGVFNAKENTNMASIFRELRESNQLPSSHLLSRLKSCLSKSDYLILFRAISERETTLDINGDASIELSKTMTDKERYLQRALRLEQRKRLLGMMRN